MPTYKIVDDKGNVLRETRSWPEIQEFYTKLRDERGASFDSALLTFKLLSVDYIGNIVVFAPTEIKHGVLGMKTEA